MNEITCGQCICPAPILTQTPNMDFCTAINTTHAICNLGLGRMPSMADMFLTGFIAGVALAIIGYMVHTIFIRGDRK